MQRHISPITGTAVTAGYKNHECSKSHKMRYSSTVLHDGDQSSLLIQQMSKLTEKQRETRKKFLEAEAVWDSKIMWDSLNQDEIDVVKAHKKAVLSGHFTYDDSKLQKKVMTRLRHFLRGSCCGNACRHVCSFLFNNQINLITSLIFLIFSAFTIMPMSQTTWKMSRFLILPFGLKQMQMHSQQNWERTCKLVFYSAIKVLFSYV